VIAVSHIILPSIVCIEESREILPVPAVATAKRLKLTKLASFPSVEAFGIGLILVTIVGDWLRDWSQIYAAAPINVGLFTLAMAHGALDADRMQQIPGWSLRLRILGEYLVLLFLACLLVLWQPIWVILLFLPVAAWHFGQDVEMPPTVLGGAVVPAKKKRADRREWFIMLRAILVVFLPIAIHPDASSRFFKISASMVSPQRPPTLPLEMPLTAIERTPWPVIAASLLLLVTTHSIVAWEKRGSGPTARRWFWRITVEHAVLLWGAIVLHPLFFVGLYLGGWHALLHWRERPRSLHRHQYIKGLAATHVFLLPVIGVVLLVWSWTPAFPGWLSLRPQDFVSSRSATSLAAIVFLTYAVVTWPHAWLQLRLQRLPNG